MTSKIRVALIKHFLEHCGERFYLRQLERLLQLPLTPARRELIRLEKMGLLKQEQEANLKFYKVNEGFEHLEELGKLVGIPETNVGVGPRARPDEGQPQGVAPTAMIHHHEVRTNWLTPVFGVIVLLMTFQVGLFYVWTHPVENSKVLVGADPRVRPDGIAGTTQRVATTEGQPQRVAPTLATDSYVMSSGKARLTSGGFGGWQ